MDYSPFNVIIWLVFIAFCFLTWLLVMLYHSRYPEYPDRKDTYDKDSNKKRSPFQRAVIPGRGALKNTKSA